MSRHHAPLCAIALAACGASPAPAVEPLPQKPTSPEAKPVDKTVFDWLDTVRAKRLAHDDRAAETALAQAISLVRRDTPGDTSIAIDEATPPLSRGLVASPDGKLWAAVLDERVAIHDTRTGLVVGSIVLHTDGVHVALLDGGKLAVADFHGVRVLDATGKVDKVLRDFGQGPIHDAAVYAGPDQRVAIADDRSVEVMSIAGKSIAHADRPAGGQKPWLEWGRWRGATLAFSDHHRTELWRATGADLALAATITDPYDAIAMAWDGRHLALHHQGTVRIVDGAGVEQARSVAQNQYLDIEQVGFVGDGVIARTRTSDVYRLGASGLVQVGSLQILSSSWLEVGDTLVTDGGTLVAAGDDFAVAPLPSPGGPIDALAWGDDRLVVFATGVGFVLRSDRIAAVTSSPMIHVGDRAVWRPGSHDLWWDIVYVPSYGAQPTLMRWDTDAATTATTPPPASIVIAFSHDGSRHLAQPAADQPLEIRDAADKQLEVVHVRDPFDLANPMPLDRAAFADGDRLLVLGGSGHTVVWNVKLKVVTWRKDEPLVDVSPDGRTVLTRTPSGIRATDLGTLRELGAIELPVGVYIPHDDRAAESAATAFSPDSATVAIGTRRGTIALVDVATWKATRTIDAHTTDVSALAWRSDGKLLASGSRGGLVKVWAPDGTPRATIALGNAVADGRATGWLALFPDGSVRGTATQHLALRVGDHPLGLDLTTPPQAPDSAWASLFQ